MNPTDRAITTAQLAQLLEMWPRRGPNGDPTVVLLGSFFPGLSVFPMPATSAGVLEIDDSGRQNLILHPAAAPPVAGSSGPEATVVDLALAALTYAANTDPEHWDPIEAERLTLRAVNALRLCQRIRGGFTV